ncbi:MAG: phosphotransferase [Myxococcota bacterium]
MRDALESFARIAVESGRLGRSRLLTRDSSLPATLDAIEGDWLANALSSFLPRARLSGVEVLDETSGTTARRRLRLRYADDAKADGAPKSVFVKIQPPGFTERLFGNLFRLGATEVGFYRDVRPSLPVQAPTCFAARDGRGGDFALVLEDLSASDAEFSTIETPISVAKATAVVRLLAKLHGHYWGSEIAEQHRWLRTPERTRNEAIERYVCVRAHRPTIERFEELLPPSVRSGAAGIHRGRRALERFWADGPRTLIHGDPHAGNLYFQRGVPGLFDWQVAQHHQGIRDVAYFLVLSLDTDLRRAHERGLFEAYVDALHEGSVPYADLDPNRLWTLYRSFSLYAYLGASVTATMSDLQPKPIARLGLRRAAAAVDDLDALPLLAQIAAG